MLHLLLLVFLLLSIVDSLPKLLGLVIQTYYQLGDCLESNLYRLPKRLHDLHKQ